MSAKGKKRAAGTGTGTGTGAGAGKRKGKGSGKECANKKPAESTEQGRDLFNALPPEGVSVNRSALESLERVWRVMTLSCSDYAGRRAEWHTLAWCESEEEVLRVASERVAFRGWPLYDLIVVRYEPEQFRVSAGQHRPTFDVALLRRVLTRAQALREEASRKKAVAV